MRNMNFGNVDRYIFYGGGQLMAELSLKLKNQGTSVFVVTSERQAKENIFHHGASSELSLVEYLKKIDIKFCVSKNIVKDQTVYDWITQNTVAISLGAAWIFKQDYVDLFKGKFVNMHPSRLPRDRGSGGYSWQILQAERLGGNSIHLVTPGIDTGDILLAQEYIFPEACKLPIDYHLYSIKQQHRLFEEFFHIINETKDFDLFPQQEKFSTYWPRLHTDVHGFIDWNWNLEQLKKFICAFDSPFSGASTYLGETRVRLKQCSSTYSDGGFHPFQSGIIFRKMESTLFVATTEGALIVEKVFDNEGNNFLENIHLGDRFYTPLKYLEKAKQFRAVYLPKGLKFE